MGTGQFLCRAFGILPLILGSVVSVLFVAGCGESPAPTVVKAPDFRVAPLVPAGDATLASFKGKPVIIYFWATWCGPCRQFAPELDEIYATYGPKGVEVMAITNEDREVVRRAEKINPHKAPVYIDETSYANSVCGIQSLPTIMVVDKKGDVIFRSVGIGPSTGFDIRGLLDEQLAEKASEEPAGSSRS